MVPSSHRDAASAKTRRLVVAILASRATQSCAVKEFKPDEIVAMDNDRLICELFIDSPDKKPSEIAARNATMLIAEAEK